MGEWRTHQHGAKGCARGPGLAEARCIPAATRAALLYDEALVRPLAGVSWHDHASRVARASVERSFGCLVEETRRARIVLALATLNADAGV